jgi:hypothetical protein
MNFLSTGSSGPELCWLNTFTAANSWNYEKDGQFIVVVWVVSWVFDVMCFDASKCSVVVLILA